MPISLNADTNIANLTKTIQVPQDSVDNVDQTSVNQPYQKLLNNFYSTLNRMPYVKPSLSMSCLDGATITVHPFDGLWASKSALLANLDYTCLSKTTSTNITAADIVGGGGYVADTIYYVYAIYDSPSGNSTKLIIRTDPPDATKTWAVVAAITHYNHRYIGSLICIAGPTILAFAMANREYDFVVQRGLGAYDAIVDTDVAISLLPTTVVTCKMFASLTNTNAANNGTFEIKPKGSTVNTFATIGKSTPDAIGISRFEIPAIGTPFFLYQVKFSGGVAAGECIAGLYWIGYRE